MALLTGFSDPEVQVYTLDEASPDVGQRLTELPFLGTDTLSTYILSLISMKSVKL